MNSIINSFSETVSDAYYSHTPLRISAGRTWIDAGRPCQGMELNVSSLSGILEYNPGDLVISAWAGTSLDEIDSTTRKFNQWIGIDPITSNRGLATIGATVATASDGPLAYSCGRIRDLILGLQTISGKGEILDAGGRTVKNVAGFDHTRLNTGAWGSLGLITKVTFRLRAIPVDERFFTVQLNSKNITTDTSNSFSPMSLEYINAELARLSGISNTPCYLVRIGGNKAHVSANIAYLRSNSSSIEITRENFLSLNSFSPKPPCSLRVSTLPYETTKAITYIEKLGALYLHKPIHISASVPRGVIRVEWEESNNSNLFIEGIKRLEQMNCNILWETLPKELWCNVSPALSNGIALGIKHALDPHNILNRGIMGECFDITNLRQQ